jgi:hypothetical protein
MTDTKPYALQLADGIETHEHHPRYFFYKKVAAELRRLHEVNSELLEALKDLCDVTDTNDYNEPAFFKAQAAIAKAEESK